MVYFSGLKYPLGQVMAVSVQLLLKLIVLLVVHSISVINTQCNLLPEIREWTNSSVYLFISH